MIVPGDIVMFEAGNLVPADLRLIEAVGLVVEEAALTGESAAVAKSVEAAVAIDAPVADRVTMAHLGTAVAGERGEGVVMATGLGTELGQIAGLLATETGVRTPLQQRLARLGRQLAIVAVALGALVMLAVELEKRVRGRRRPTAPTISC